VPEAESGAAVASVPERSSDLVEGVRSDPAKAAAPAIAQGVKTVSKEPLEALRSTLRDASGAELLSQAAPPLREMVDFVTSPVAELMSPVTESLMPPAAAVFGPPAAHDQASNFIGPEPAGPLAAAEPTIAAPENGSLAKLLGAFGGVEPRRSEVAGGSVSSAGLPLQAKRAAIDHYLGSVTSSGIRGNSVPDRPAPPFQSPDSAAGPGGSFFVPLAALLALLALAAQATFRRRREVPDFLAPTPFVCALERPG
jgi:hypothetical protein